MEERTPDDLVPPVPLENEDRDPLDPPLEVAEVKVVLKTECCGLKRLVVCLGFPRKMASKTSMTMKRRGRDDEGLGKLKLKDVFKDCGRRGPRGKDEEWTRNEMV